MVIIKYENNLYKNTCNYIYVAKTAKVFVKKEVETIVMNFENDEYVEIINNQLVVDDEIYVFDELHLEKLVPCKILELMSATCNTYKCLLNNKLCYISFDEESEIELKFYENVNELKITNIYFE